MTEKKFETSISEESCKNCRLSDSDSSIADLTNSPKSSPVKSVEPGFNRKKEQFSPGKHIDMSQSSKSSQDVLLFSQNSAKLDLDSHTIDNCIESIRVSESEDEDEEMLLSPSVNFKNLTQSSLPLLQPVCDILPSCDASTDVCWVNQTPAQNANISPLQCRNGESVSTKQKDLIIRDKLSPEGSLISPFIGQRGMSLKENTMELKKRMCTIQNVDLPDSLQEKNPRISCPESIMEINGIKDLGVSSTASITQPLVDDGKTIVDNTVDIDIFENKVSVAKITKRENLKRKSDVLDENIIGKSSVKSLACVTALVEKPPAIINKPFSACLEPSDSDEDPVYGYKNENQRISSIDLICPKYSKELSLKNKTIHENPKLAYIKSEDENLIDCHKRILNLINRSLLTLEKYQRNLTCRIQWSQPIGIDKRLKDALDRPRVLRKQDETLQNSVDKELSHRVTRSALRTSPAAQEIDSFSEESLPDVAMYSGWIDASGKTSVKKGNLRMGLSRKSPKLSATLLNKNMNVDSDSDDFDIVPTSRPTPHTKQMALVSSKSDQSRVCSKANPLLRIDEEEETNFDIDDILENTPKSSLVADGNVICLAQDSKLKIESSKVEESRDQPENIHVGHIPRKRLRKTFSLTAKLDEDHQESSRSDGPAIKIENIDVRNRNINQVVTPRKPVHCIEETKVKNRGIIRSPAQVPNSESVRNKEPLLFFISDNAKLNENRRIDQIAESIPEINPTTKISTNERSLKTKEQPVSIKPEPLRLKGKHLRRKGRATTSREKHIDCQYEIEDFPSPSAETAVQDHLNNGVTANNPEEESIECPLCQKTFSINVIEVHASTCLDPHESHAPQQVENVNLRGRRTNPPKDVMTCIDSSGDESGAVQVVSVSRRERARTPLDHARLHVL
ncbi:hypothetical protein SK128_005586 [Halocaridina rubra]|uniref:Uncharacterized protein n=1 Tax=Halocaridina rubra TaxID=373956 RepID=A0AAN9AH00_HALRR